VVSWWVVLLVLATVAGASVLVGLAGGWRPGGRSRPGPDAVAAQVQERFGVPTADWLRVRRAVRRGRAAPEPLRPAAYALATALARHQDGSRWPPAGPVRVLTLAAVYGVAGTAWTVADGFGWSTVLRPLPTVLLVAVLFLAADRRRAALRAAAASNGPRR
jgi:hypothetical protein